MSTNDEIASIFEAMADILEIKNVQWKPRAYRTAARQIKDMHSDVRVLYNKGGIESLKEISGIGEHMASKIEEYVKTGKIKEYEKLKKSIPEGLNAIMNIPGMGPKKSYILYKKLKIKSLNDLKKAVNEHKVRKISGFGEASEAKIQETLGLTKTHKERHPYKTVYTFAKKIVDELKKLKEVERIEIGGSLRRKEDTIGDIDLIAVSKKPDKVMYAFTELSLVKKIIAKGSKKSVIILKNGMQCDLRVFDKRSFGAAMQYFTGNKAHNIELRKIAINKGYMLNEYGVFDRKTKKMIAGETEEDVYRALGLRYIPPEKRKNTGELEEYRL